MKTTFGLIGLVGLIGLSGCATGQNQGLLNANNATPPTALERQLFEVITNTRPVVVTTTNVVTLYQTNQVVETRTVTNQVGLTVPVWITNHVTDVTCVTNVTSATNMVEGYQLAPGKGSGAAAAVGGAVAAPFGWGGVVCLVLGCVANGWLTWRNKALAGNVKTTTAVAETLAQNIQTLRRVIESTAQGQQLGALVKQYMQAHQGQAGVIQEVTEIVKNVVDDKSAQLAADEIQKLMATVTTTATPKT